MGLFGSGKRKERENAKDAQIAALQNQLDIARAQPPPIRPPRPTRDAGEIDRLKNEVRRLNSTVAQKDLELRDAKFNRTRYDAEEIDRLNNEVRRLNFTVAKKDQELRDAEFSRLHYDAGEIDRLKNEVRRLNSTVAKRDSELRDAEFSRVRTLEGLLSQKENKIAALERHLQEKISSSARVTRQLDMKNEAFEMLRSELEILVHDLETHKDRSKREKERLDATEALLSQREGRIAELESEMQENADMVANTRLLLNQSRNEVNNEKRRARLAAEAVADKNRKMEFLQQECARLYVSRGGGDANMERKTRKEEGRMRG